MEFMSSDSTRIDLTTIDRMVYWLVEMFISIIPLHSLTVLFITSWFSFVDCIVYLISDWIEISYTIASILR